MDGFRFPVSVRGHGTLAANMIRHFKLPADMTLVRVDMVATTAAVGSVKIGTDADDDCYLPDTTVGASNVPVTKGRGDFTGVANPLPAECPHIAKDTVILVTVTHNSMINFDCDLTFLEG